jgi:repressor LexA
LSRGSPITVAQLRVLRAIEDFIALHKFPPTVRELCRRLGTTSTNNVAERLAILERKGFIAREPLKSRAIKVLRSSKEAA